MKRQLIGLLLTLVGTVTAASQPVIMPTDGTLPRANILSLATPEMKKQLEDKKHCLFSTHATRAVSLMKGDPFVELALEKHQDLASYKIFHKTHNASHKRRAFTEKNMGGIHFDVTTQDGETISCTFIDNHSDTLLAIGHGFTDSREVSVPVGALFGLKATKTLPSPAYDILLIELRGHGTEHKPHGRWLSPHSIIRDRFLKSGVDIDKIRLGTHEHFDVKAAIEKTHELAGNRHTRTFGYAMCYSTMAFVRAQALFPNLFDKLVLDSVWISVRHLIDALSQEPRFLARPQKGGGQFLPGVVTGTQWFSWMLRKTFSYLSSVDIDAAEEMTPYLEKVTIPIFFIHALFDRFTTYENMLKLLKVKKGPYALLLTPHQHIISHLKSREIIRELCWQFFEDDVNLSGLTNLVEVSRREEKNTVE